MKITIYHVTIDLTRLDSIRFLGTLPIQMLKLRKKSQIDLKLSIRYR